MFEEKIEVGGGTDEEEKKESEKSEIEEKDEEKNSLGEEKDAVVTVDDNNDDDEDDTRLFSIKETIEMLDLDGTGDKPQPEWAKNIDFQHYNGLAVVTIPGSALGE